MNVRQLRAILQRYKNAGVLFVGAYLLLHHVWRHRRLQLLVPVGLLSCLSVWILMRPAPVQHVRRKTTAPPVVFTPPPTVPRPLEPADETMPFPLPAAEGKGPFPAAGAIFFTANFYHWSGHYYQEADWNDGKKEETLAADQETSHLFRLTRGASHPRQITFGDCEDWSPLLSPDGKQLAFLRQNNDTTSVCLISTQGGRVRTLHRLPTNDHRFTLKWSPNGRWLSLRLDDSREAAPLLLFRLGRRTTLKLPDIREAVWSPDSRLYLRDKSNDGRIFRPDDGSSTPLKTVVWNAVWKDAHTLIGDQPTPGTEDMQYTSAVFRVIDDQGRQIRELPLKRASENPEESLTFYGGHVWHCLPYHPSVMLLETAEDSSAGGWFDCYLVNINNGKTISLVENGVLVGISPDGTQAAVTVPGWVGPYHRGGARVGPLKIVSLISGRTKDVTNPLSAIWAGGTWAAGTHRIKIPR